MLENVIKAIDENTTLTADFKENIKGLVIVFNNIFPNIDLRNLEERLKTLQLEKSSKFISKRVFNYIPLTNVLSFNLEELDKGYDVKHVMMSALLTIMTSHDNTYGFDENDKFITFNTGYTEILSNFVIGNESEKILFEDEIIATNLISEIVGNDTMFRAYFTNNPSLIEEKIKSYDMEMV